MCVAEGILRYALNDGWYKMIYKGFQLMSST